MADVAPDGVVRVRAPNPSALTLDGTNTYVVRGWVVDPGPLIEEHVEAILAAARKNKCDAIVMASHGRRGLSAVLLGSETQKVLTHTKLPVIVVR